MQFDPSAATSTTPAAAPLATAARSAAAPAPAGRTAGAGPRLIGVHGVRLHSGALEDLVRARRLSQSTVAIIKENISFTFVSSLLALRQAPVAQADLVLGSAEGSLLDIVDNVLSKGVVLTGDITIGLASHAFAHGADDAVPGAPDPQGADHDQVVR